MYLYIWFVFDDAFLNPSVWISVFTHHFFWGLWHSSTQRILQTGGKSNSTSEHAIPWGSYLHFPPFISITLQGDSSLHSINLVIGSCFSCKQSCFSLQQVQLALEAVLSCVREHNNVAQRWPPGAACGLIGLHPSSQALWRAWHKVWDAAHLTSLRVTPNWLLK